MSWSPNNQLSRGLTWNKVGRSPDDFFLVHAGIDPTNGHALYTKLDGTTTDVTVLVIEHLQVKLHMLNMKVDLVCNLLTRI
jgi:hypothetical protein